MKVKTFDTQLIEKLLAESDPYLRVYIEALQRSAAHWEDIANKAVESLNKYRMRDNTDTEDIS